MADNKTQKMGTAPILSLIFSMSLPAMFSMLVQSMYNIVDSIFVAQLGESALTAVSLAFPLQNLLIAVGVGTGVGLNSIISRRLGEHNEESASRTASHGIFLAICNSFVFVIFGFLFNRPFLQLFTEDPQVIQYGVDYLSVITTFCFGSMIQLALEKTIQSTGNMFYPMLIQLVGAITNIILDPIMIFGLFGFPALGVSGAAIATVIGQMVGMSLALYVVLRKNLAVKIHFKGFKPDMATIKNIYAVGLPSMVMQSIGSLLTTMINGILMSFSGAAVSVYGVYMKLQSFVMMPVFGLNQGLMPIMGYNYGAGNKKRLMQTLKYGTIIAACIMIAGTVVFMVFPVQMLQLFNASPDMMEIGVVALRTLSLSFLLASINIIFSTFFQALGNGVYSLIISVSRQLVIILPVAFFMAKFFGLDQVWLSMPIAEVVATVASIFMMRHVIRKSIDPMTEKITQ